MLADRSDVDRATIGRLESGAMARMDTIHKLAIALQVSAAELQARPAAEADRGRDREQRTGGGREQRTAGT